MRAAWLLLRTPWLARRGVVGTVPHLRIDYIEPTTIKQLTLITAAPVLRLGDLKARDEVDTCAWVDGDPDRPVTCPAGHTCGTGGVANSFIACCDQASCIDSPHLCVDHRATACADAAICNSVYSTGTKCPRDLPYCVTYAVGSELTSFSCATSSTRIVLLTTTTNENDGGTQETSSPTDTTIGSRDGNDNASGGSTTAQSRPITTGGGDNGGDGDGSSNITPGEWGGIAVGIIFGVATIVVAVLLAIWPAKVKAFLEKWLCCGMCK